LSSPEIFWANNIPLPKPRTIRKAGARGIATAAFFHEYLPHSSRST
jgi:hypothetical protein